MRSLLEYSCETWNPYTKRNIDKLEAGQRRAPRWITMSVDDYDTRLSKSNLLSLFNRRFIRYVTFSFDVINPRRHGPKKVTRRHKGGSSDPPSAFSAIRSQ